MAARYGELQVGPATANLLVDHFGDATARALASATQLRSVRGIGKSKAATIAKHWQKDTRTGIRPTIMFLVAQFNLTFAQAKVLLNRYGVAAPDIVKRNPYRLIDDIQGVGFVRADEIARRMGLPVDSPDRVQSSLIHVLSNAGTSGGHTCLAREALCDTAAGLLRTPAFTAPPAALAQSVAALVDSGRLRAEDDRVYLAPMHVAEESLARSLRVLLRYGDDGGVGVGGGGGSAGAGAAGDRDVVGAGATPAPAAPHVDPRLSSGTVKTVPGNLLPSNISKRLLDLLYSTR
jgi:exodeoxyribonuclease V alpha subunit